MIISSLVVETLREHTAEVAKQLETIEGVEVHGVEDYKIIITIETETIESSHATASSFVSITGVTNINLVYVNFEDDPKIAKAAKR